MKTGRSLATGVLATIVLGSAIAGPAMGLRQAKSASRGAAKAAQKATVTINGGYTPRSISVKAGKPVQLTFVRKEKAGCGDVIHFPTLGLKRSLKPGQKTVVQFTPKKAGAIPFTCGMKMYKGQAVAK